MPTIVRKLYKVYREELHALCLSTYFDVECYAFATALHRGLGWPMIGLIREDGVIRHVAVQNPDGKLHDARGFVSEDEFGGAFGFYPPYNMREVDEKDLYKEGETTETRERSIKSALNIAEVLWPGLPWKESFESKVIAFADDLEKISRKHGLWVRSIVPASPPLIADGDGAEGGYEISSTADGNARTIDRYFE